MTKQIKDDIQTGFIIFAIIMVLFVFGWVFRGIQDKRIAADERSSTQLIHDAEIASLRKEAVKRGCGEWIITDSASGTSQFRFK